MLQPCRTHLEQLAALSESQLRKVTSTVQYSAPARPNLTWGMEMWTQ